MGPIGQFTQWLVNRTLTPLGERSGARGGIYFAVAIGVALVGAGAATFWWFDRFRGAILFGGGVATLEPRKTETQAPETIS